MMRVGAAALMLALVAPVSQVVAQSALPAGGEFQALITDERLNEISGFAASRRHPGVIWAHNDGGDRPVLYAISPQGRLLARVRVQGATNIDWEDIALLERDGKTLLLIADTGDNGGLRRELTIYAVEEPGRIADTRVRPAWSLRFSWPDGARDCEAMTVDPISGEILLVSKKRVPPELFVLPASPPATQPLIAQRVGMFAGVTQPDDSDLQRNPVYGRYRAQISGVDIDASGARLALLNYRQVLLYSRAQNETWSSAIARAPRPIAYPWLPQAEAISFSADGQHLLIGSERIPSPLLRIAISP